MFKLTFKTDNAAFDEPATEAGRILREIARKIEYGEAFGGAVQDINGNRIGNWVFEPSADEQDEG